MNYTRLYAAGAGLTLLSALTFCAMVPAHGDPVVIGTFDTTTGIDPAGSLTIDSSGDLFGTTSSGGANGYGTVYEIAHGSSVITPLASFDSTNGNGAKQGVTFDSSGNLFGTTVYGTSGGYGKVFEIAHGSSAITTVADFTMTNGAYPTGPVTFDSSGNLFGTAGAFGPGGNGTVFEIAPGSSVISDLGTFNSANGIGLDGATALDSSGNIYGATLNGGSANLGTIFEITKGGGTTALASFDGANGGYPFGGVTLDSSGNLFATANGGGANTDGTLIEVAKGSHSITTLADFSSASGTNPFSRVIIDSSGALYGTTNIGGAAAYGTVYRLNPGSHTITVIGNITKSDGGSSSGVVLDSSGTLYGTTLSGGANGDGTVFAIADARTAAVPETSTVVSFGLLLTLGLRLFAVQRRRRA